jgi:hypothetical protein
MRDMAQVLLMSIGLFAIFWSCIGGVKADVSKMDCYNCKIEMFGEFE